MACIALLKLINKKINKLEKLCFYVSGLSYGNVVAILSTPIFVLSLPTEKVVPVYSGLIPYEPLISCTFMLFISFYVLYIRSHEKKITPYEILFRTGFVSILIPVCIYFF